MTAHPQEQHETTGLLTSMRAPEVPHRGRLVLAPHAGAGPHALLDIVRTMPAWMDVVGVTLPGREGRLLDDPAVLPSDPQAVVREIVDELASLRPLPTAIFGHSMGAVVAAAIALERRADLRGLVLSAFPSTGTAAQRAGRWTDAELWGILGRGGGTPDDILASRAWRRHLLGLLRADLTFGVRLGMSVDLDRLTVPLTVLGGDGDEIVDVRAVGATAPGGSVRRRLFPGGHFYLLEERNLHGVGVEIMAAIGQATRAQHRRRRTPVHAEAGDRRPAHRQDGPRP